MELGAAKMSFDLFGGANGVVKRVKLHSAYRDEI